MSDKTTDKTPTELWYVDWCKKTGRNSDGSSVLITNSITECLESYSSELIKENEELKKKVDWQKLTEDLDSLNEITQLQSINEYWKQRCEAAEELLKVMERPKNCAGSDDNNQYEQYVERHNKYISLKHKQQKQI